jgi:hypothetical protein
MDKAMELLEQLSIKLGVATEYLWAILVKQQYAEGITNIVFAIIGIIVIIVLLCCTPKTIIFFTNKHKELIEDRIKNGTGWNGSHFISSGKEDFYDIMIKSIPIFEFILIIIIIWSISYDIEYGIQHLFNPDYFALREILDTISGSGQ